MSDDYNMKMNLVFIFQKIMELLVNKQYDHIFLQ